MELVPQPAAEGPLVSSWADLAYDMWSLLCTSQAIEGQGDWEQEKGRLRQRLYELLAAAPAPPGPDVSVEWREPVAHHPEPGYSPVRVPENTGKHPRESAETYTDADGNEVCPPTCSCRTDRQKAEQGGMH